jgi:hypothetical protein
LAAAVHVRSLSERGLQVSHLRAGGAAGKAIDPGGEDLVVFLIRVALEVIDGQGGAGGEAPNVSVPGLGVMASLTSVTFQ